MVSGNPWQKDKDWLNDSQTLPVPGSLVLLHTLQHVPKLCQGFNLHRMGIANSFFPVISLIACCTYTDSCLASFVAITSSNSVSGIAATCSARLASRTVTPASANTSAFDFWQVLPEVVLACLAPCVFGMAALISPIRRQARNLISAAHVSKSMSLACRP